MWLVGGVTTDTNDDSSEESTPAVRLLNYIETTLRQEKTNPPVVPILIATYMRSGSTWLGAIANQAKESFYLYEPFQFLLENGYYTTGNVCFYNNTCRYAKFFIHFTSREMMVLVAYVLQASR